MHSARGDQSKMAEKHKSRIVYCYETVSGTGRKGGGGSGEKCYKARLRNYCFPMFMTLFRFHNSVESRGF
jgi:hypothetical protein